VKVIHYVESEEYLSDNRYTYGQPVRGRADILITIGNSTQAYSKYDTSRYGSKSVNVEVCMTNFCIFLLVTPSIPYCLSCVDRLPVMCLWCRPTQLLQKALF